MQADFNQFIFCSKASGFDNDYHDRYMHVHVARDLLIEFYQPRYVACVWGDTCILLTLHRVVVVLSGQLLQMQEHKFEVYCILSFYMHENQTVGINTDIERCLSFHAIKHLFFGVLTSVNQILVWDRQNF